METALKECGEREADEAEDECPPGTSEPLEPDCCGQNDGQRHRPPARRRVPCGAPEVAEHRGRPAELLSATPDADVEPVGQDEIRQPERDPEHQHRHAGDNGCTDPVTAGGEHVRSLAAQEQYPVRMGRDHE